MLCPCARRIALSWHFPHRLTRCPLHRPRRCSLPPARGRLKLHAGTKAERLEPAVVMDGAGPSALFVKVLSTGEKRYSGVSEADLVPLPRRAFLPGERVRRAMWSGEEEDAEARAHALALRCARATPRVVHRAAFARCVRACAPMRALAHAAWRPQALTHTCARC
jgi:hypothetical protein